MNDKTVEIVITVNMFTRSASHEACINIELDSVIDTTAFGELSIFSTDLFYSFYSNIKLQNVDCFRCDLGSYFSDVLNITDNI